MTVQSEPRPRRRSRLAIARLAALVFVLVVVGITLAAVGTGGLRDLLADVGESRWGFIAFVIVYAVAVVLLMPGTLGTLTAGAVFGFPLGAAAALAGATIGATIAFVISRVVGREGAQSLLGARSIDVDHFIGRNDFVSMLLLRLMPIVPFNLLNYAAGLTAVRPSRYVVATMIGMVPGALLTTGLADQADDPTGAPFIILFGIFLVALIGSGIAGRRMQGNGDS